MPKVSGDREASENGVIGSVVGATRSKLVRSYNEVEISVRAENVCSQLRIAVCCRRRR